MRISLGRVPRRLPGVLRGLVTVAGSLIALGLILSAPPDPVNDPSRIGAPWRALTPGGGGLPAAILDLGLLVLMASPAVVLAILLRSFLRWGDRLMAGLVGAVLGVLALAFFLGAR